MNALILILSASFFMAVPTWAEAPEQRIFVDLTGESLSSTTPNSVPVIQEAFRKAAQFSLPGTSGATQVLADLLLEKGSSYGLFLSLLKSAFDQSLPAESLKIRKKALRILQRDFDSWFPEGSLSNGWIRPATRPKGDPMDYGISSSSCPSGVFLSSEGIIGFEFHSVESAERFFARRGVEIFDSWKMQVLRIKSNHLDAEKVSTKLLKRLAKLHSLQSLDLQFGVRVQHLKALHGASVRNLTLLARELLPQDVLGLNGLNHLESLVLDFPFRYWKTNEYPRNALVEYQQYSIGWSCVLPWQWSRELNRMQAGFSRPLNLKFYLDPEVQLADREFAGFRSVDILSNTKRRNSCSELLNSAAPALAPALNSGYNRTP